MSASIDQLQLNINAQASRANDALDRLVGKLDRLSASLGGLNTANLTNLANGVSQLSTAMLNMKNVNMADFTRLASGIGKLANINVGALNQASTSIHSFVRSLSTLGGLSIPDTVKQLSELANGIAKFGYKSASQAITNIPKLAVAMRQLMTSLSSAPKVSQNLIDMTNALARLSASLKGVSTHSQKASKGLNLFHRSSAFTSRSSFNLASAIGTLYARFWMLIRVFRWIREAINISSELTEVQNVVDVTFGQAADKVEKFADVSIEKFGMSELTLKKVSSRFQAMGAAMEIDSGAVSRANEFLNKQTRGYIEMSDSLADVSLNLTKLTADMASLYNLDQDEVAEDLQAIYTGQTKPLRQYGIDLTQATLKEWALNNGLNANIESMTQAEKAMLRYQYVLAHSTAAHGDFERTINTWANQTRILKENIRELASVIGSTFINALKPLVMALNSAMSHIINFVKVVSNSLGKIFGWSYEEGNAGIANDMEDAADGAYDIAGGLGDAEKAAKKLKSHLLGIDELNVYEPNVDTGKGNGSGSGSGGSGGGIADEGQWIKTESILKMYESELDTLYKLGEHIGDAITKALNGINWNNAYQSARNFGKGLADFLNGLISPELFSAVGQTIAGSLNQVIYASLSFTDTFDFYEFGTSIAAGINRFFSTFDFSGLAQSINGWVDGLRDAIGGFLDTLDWKVVFQSLYDFVSNIEIDTITFIAGAFAFKFAVKKLFAAIGTAFATAKIKFTEKLLSIDVPQFIMNFSSFAIGNGALNFFAFSGIANRIMDAISEAIDMLLPDWAFDLLSNMGAGLVVGALAGSWFPGAGTIAGAIIGAITGALTSIKIDGKSILRSLLEPIFNWDATLDVFSQAKQNFAKGGWNIVLGIGEGILGALGFLVEPIGDLFAFVWETICDVFGINGTAKEMKPLGKNIFEGIVEGFESAFDSFGESMGKFWNEKVKPWFTIEKWSQTFNNIKEALKRKWDETSEQWKLNIGTWWDEDVKSWFTVEKWSGILDSIRTSFETKWEETSQKWKLDISTWWDEDVKPWFTSEKWLTLLDTIKKSFDTKWKETLEKWNTNISSWWNTNVSPWFTADKWLKLLDGMKKSFSQKWSETSNEWSRNISAWWNTKVSPWFTLEKWTSLLSKIPSAFGQAFRNGANAAIDVLNNLIRWVNNKLKFSWDAHPLWGIEAGSIQLMTIPEIPRFATGGFPEDGLFMANSSELVGQFSNGRTAVANNGQIIEGIEGGVERAVARVLAPYLADIAQNTRETANKDFAVNIGDKEIARANRRGTAKLGYELIT